MNHCADSLCESIFSQRQNNKWRVFGWSRDYKSSCRMHCVLLPDQKMKVWISAIHKIWLEADPQSSTAYLHPVQEVPPCLSLPSMEAGRIIHHREDLALMENVYYLGITVIFPVMKSTWREDCSLDFPGLCQDTEHTPAIQGANYRKCVSP